MLSPFCPSASEILSDLWYFTYPKQHENFSQHLRNKPARQYLGMYYNLDLPENIVFAMQPGCWILCCTKMRNGTSSEQKA